MIENVIVLSPIALIIYLLIAGILGWAIRSMTRRVWQHRFWEHGHMYHYPKRHTYIEHTPEVEQPQPIPTPSVQAPITRSDTSFDLKVVEGIDYIVESILNKAGIFTTQDLAETPAGEIREILTYSGLSIDSYDPTTWPHQAHLAWNEKWDELKRYQDFLKMQ